MTSPHTYSRHPHHPPPLYLRCTFTSEFRERFDPSDPSRALIKRWPINSAVNYAGAGSGGYRPRGCEEAAAREVASIMRASSADNNVFGLVGRND